MKSMDLRRISEEDLVKMARTGELAKREVLRRFSASFTTKLVSALGPVMEEPAPEVIEPELAAVPVAEFNPEIVYEGVVQLLQNAGPLSATAICKELNLSKPEWNSVRARIGNGNAEIEKSGQRRGTKYQIRPAA